MKRYLYENRYIIAFSIFIAIFSFGYELFNFTLSIDEEIDSFRNARDSYVYIFVGRWGLYFLNQLVVPHSSMPYFPTLIALFGIALSSILFLSSQKDNLTAKLLFATLFISSPIHSYYLAFNTSGLYYSIGMILTTISYLSFQKAIESKKVLYSYYIYSILLLAFSLSLYQALLSYFFVFAAYYLLFSFLQSPSLNIPLLLKRISALLAISGLAFLVYQIGDIATRKFVLEPSEMEIPQYLDGFIAWGKTPLTNIFSHLLMSTKEYLSGGNPSTGELGLSIKTFVVIIPVFTFLLIRKTSGFLKIIITLFLVTILILSPFAVMYLNGLKLPTRTFMSLPLMVAIIWLMTYRYANYWFRKIMILFAFVILINNIYTNTRLFYSSYVSSQADRNMAIRIIERIYNLDPPVVNEHIQVFFVGMHQHKTNALFFKSDVFGASFFEWNPGSQYRIISFFRTLGMEELIAIPQEKRAQYKDEISKMPYWPSKGSVRLIDGVTVIKLSEPIKK
ncbi:MAG: hypothetical protein GQ527_11620 [Bacteroidales bacterium]|nr:hypothetical protein [Bacteroidales bacterium]